MPAVTRHEVHWVVCCLTYCFYLDTRHSFVLIKRALSVKSGLFYQKIIDNGLIAPKCIEVVYKFILNQSLKTGRINLCVVVW